MGSAVEGGRRCRAPAPRLTVARFVGLRPAMLPPARTAAFLEAISPPHVTDAEAPDDH